MRVTSRSGSSVFLVTDHMAHDLQLSTMMNEQDENMELFESKLRSLSLAFCGVYRTQRACVRCTRPCSIAFILFLDLRLVLLFFYDNVRFLFVVSMKAVVISGKLAQMVCFFFFFVCLCDMFPFAQENEADEKLKYATRLREAANEWSFLADDFRRKRVKYDNNDEIATQEANHWMRQEIHKA